MSFDPVTYSAVKELEKKIGSGGAEVPKYEYIWTSRSITVSKDAELTIRAMGAGAGGNNTSPGNGGNGGTVALKTISVNSGDEIEVIIPAGGTANAVGGDLHVNVNGSQALMIPGAKNNKTANDDPVGADWFAGGAIATGWGGGSAMIVEGGVGSRIHTGTGGAGALGDGSDGGGGALTSAVGMNGGKGMLTLDMCILRIIDSGPAGGSTNVNGGSGGGSFGGGGYGGYGGFGGVGGFGGGGGGGDDASVNAGDGGFGGGGGGRNGGKSGDGGFGGGGGFSRGRGGQGWVTLEWRYI